MGQGSGGEALWEGGEGHTEKRQRVIIMSGQVCAFVSWRSSSTYV